MGESLIDYITVRRTSNMWKLAALFIFFLGINSLLECSANVDDPAVEEEEDELKALREDLEDLFETALDERMDEVMNELKAVRMKLDQVQAACAGGAIPAESPVEEDGGDEDVGDEDDEDVDEEADEVDNNVEE